MIKRKIIHQYTYLFSIVDGDLNNNTHESSLVSKNRKYTPRKMSSCTQNTLGYFFFIGKQKG